MRLFFLAFLGPIGILLASCGGDGNSDFYPSGNTGGGGSGTGGDGLNSVAVVVDTGPGGAGSPNTLYTTVTLCAPNSTTACQTIDHVQVDTGSTGFRVLASVLTGALTPMQLPQATFAGGNLLNECVQFADGYSWGSVRNADLVIGSDTAAGMPIQVIGDAAATVPASCVMGPVENTVLALGANAILGVGNFLTDCGSSCATSAPTGAYYECDATGACQPVSVTQTQQLQNPCRSSSRTTMAW